jgi:hypothetical protein
MELKVNSDAVRRHADALERVSKRALPLAVRQTLNSMAYDVKQKTMPESAGKFVQRKPSFFKATSKVEQASGLDVVSMRAVVGFVPPANDKGRAVEDLEEQEVGGNIGGRSFIPLKGARTSRSWNKMVKAGMRMGDVANKMIKAQDLVRGMRNYSPDKRRRQQWMKSAIHAKKGGMVLGSYKARGVGGRYLYYINSVKRKANGKTVVNATPIYHVKRNRAVRVEATRFMRVASMKSAGKGDQFFEQHAERAIKGVGK